MTRNEIKDDYFEWIFDLMCRGRFSRRISYRKLMMFLHDTPFRYSILKDENRYADGIALRHKYGRRHDCVEDADRYLDGPCSVLEMMVALAMRCEDTIMDDPELGNRTAHWFWGMVTSLGLGSMNDQTFDKRYVKDVVERFLDRNYEPTGKGGLFTIRDCEYDLRDVEIWYQLCWYLDKLT